MGVLESFNVSIDLAIKDGRLDVNKHGAVIEAARKVAAIMDDDEWPMVRGKIDNVSPSVFLKYCDSLGILPDGKSMAPKPKAKLATITASSKFSKASNG